MTRKKILPLAMTVAFGLSACGGEQWGDTNDGLPNTGTGALGDGAANTLLLLGGLVGVGAILSSSDDDSGVVVSTAGNSATGGGSTDGTDGSSGTGDGSTAGSTDNGGNGTDGSTGSSDGSNGSNDGSNGATDSNSGNGGSDETNDSNTGNNGSDDSNSNTDGSDGTNGSTDGSGGSGSNNDGSDGSGGSNNNGSDGTGDGSTGTDGDGGTGGSGDNTDGSNNTSNPGEDPDTTVVQFLEPPEWLLGMWRGTDSNGSSQTAFGSPQEIGIGDTGSVITEYSKIPEVCLHLSQSNDNVFEYTIWYPGADGKDVIINEKWENNGDGSVLYTVSGVREDSFMLYTTKASDYLTPPSWLQGSWQGASANGGTIVVADISAGNITIGDQGGSRTSMYALASQPKSVLRVNQNDARNYSVTVVTSGAASQTVSNTFTSSGTNTLNYRGSAGEASMTRQ